MASPHRFRENQPSCSGLALTVIAFALIVTGCRSTGGSSSVPGIGWLANRSGAAAKSEVDPAANFPAPSSVATPQTLADAERSSTQPTHNPVNHEAQSNSAETVSPAIYYPSTGYAAIASNSQGTRPEPNPVGGSASSADTASPGSNYVQQGSYSANNGGGTSSPTTWDAPAPAQDASSGAASTASSSIYGTPAQTATDAVSTGTSDSMYGNQSAPATPSPYQSAVTSSTPAAPVTYPGGQVASEIGTTQYPGTENAVYGAVATDAGAVPGSVGQASYSDPVAGLPSQYPAASTPEVRTATTAGQPWRPGSTTNYQ